MDIKNLIAKVLSITICICSNYKMIVIKQGMFSKFSTNASSIQKQYPLSTLDGSKSLAKKIVSQVRCWRCSTLTWCGQYTVITQGRKGSTRNNAPSKTVYCCIFKVASFARRQASEMTPVSPQSRSCHKHTDITPHIPVLVYCEVFTNVCFSRNICIWGETRIHTWYKSRQLPRWALEKETKDEQKLQQVNNNNTTPGLLQYSRPTLIYLQWWSLLYVLPIWASRVIVLYPINLKPRQKALGLWCKAKWNNKNL